MAEIMVEIDRSKLPDHTDKQFEAWVKFETGYTADIKLDNPLHDTDMEAEFVYVR